jgi:hypothetical protein
MKATIEVRDLTGPHSDALKQSARCIEKGGEDDARYLHAALLPVWAPDTVPPWLIVALVVLVLWRLKLGGVVMLFALLGLLPHWHPLRIRPE